MIAILEQSKLVGSTRLFAVEWGVPTRDSEIWKGFSIAKEGGRRWGDIRFCICMFVRGYSIPYKLRPLHLHVGLLLDHSQRRGIDIYGIIIANYVMPEKGFPSSMIYYSLYTKAYTSAGRWNKSSPNLGSDSLSFLTSSVGFTCTSTVMPVLTWTSPSASMDLWLFFLLKWPAS